MPPDQPSPLLGQSRHRECGPDYQSMLHPAGECPWCDQALFDLHVQAKVAGDDYKDRYGEYPDLSEFC